MRPPDAQRPPAAAPAGEQDSVGTERQGQEYPHDPARCATCARPHPSIRFIGTPARQLAGQILSGDQPIQMIAYELVDMLGRDTCRMLANELRVAAEDLL